ncbi:hypothetical protein DXG03_004065 [Asterophora parasitica]|uniref:Septin-type G domain-containing protein n=1 Tax=Asterophora parasitica TaxID=117018 RepID=A0A9P7GA13_9AGAR|nr:hypothetical protein DXG03_004065 [Asterophora parasitica]
MSGTGRTTFVNTLCEQEVLAHKIIDSPETANVEEVVTIRPVNNTVFLTSHDYAELEEDNVRISLTVVDTPGFGNNIDNEHTFQEIVTYLERQYDDILAEQSRIKRNPRFRDSRVHAVLYFISPTGHAYVLKDLLLFTRACLRLCLPLFLRSLKEMDIELMRRLSPRVNVIPVIGRSDTLTPSELREFKQRIKEDIEYYGIPIYNFPYDEEEDDEETIQDNIELRALLPFAVIGSEEEYEIRGERVRARVYPWGTAEVDNPNHSDFTRLRGAILGSHLNDLKSLTEDILYETYRTEKLSKTVTDNRQSQVLPEDLANQSVRLKEEQLRREEEKLREIELRVQREINEKRQELLAKEETLRVISTIFLGFANDWGDTLGLPFSECSVFTEFSTWHHFRGPNGTATLLATLCTYEPMQPEGLDDDELEQIRRYEDFTTIDWIQDSILERNRRIRTSYTYSHEHHAHGWKNESRWPWIWSKARKAFDTGQSWFVVSLAGAAYTSSSRSNLTSFP